MGRLPVESELAAVSGLTDDRVRVRIFTLADHAVLAPDQKLYMNGGAIGQVGLAQYPGQLMPLFLAISLHIPWAMTSETTTLTIRVLDADRNPVGPDPLASGTMEVGRAPGLRPGDENTFSMVIPVGGYPVQSEGTIYFHLTVGEQSVAVLPLKLRSAAAILQG